MQLKPVFKTVNNIVSVHCPVRLTRVISLDQDDTLINGLLGGVVFWFCFSRIFMKTTCQIFVKFYMQMWVLSGAN